MVELFHGSPLFHVFDIFEVVCIGRVRLYHTLTLISNCSYISLLWHKIGSRSLGCIVRKLQYKIYRYVSGGVGGESVIGPLRKP